MPLEIRSPARFRSPFGLRSGLDDGGGGPRRRRVSPGAGRASRKGARARLSIRSEKPAIACQGHPGIVAFWHERSSDNDGVHSMSTLSLPAARTSSSAACRLARALSLLSHVNRTHESFPGLLDLPADGARWAALFPGRRDLRGRGARASAHCVDRATRDGRTQRRRQTELLVSSSEGPRRLQEAGGIRLVPSMKVAGGPGFHATRPATRGARGAVAVLLMHRPSAPSGQPSAQRDSCEQALSGRLPLSP